MEYLASDLKRSVRSVRMYVATLASRGLLVRPVPSSFRTAHISLETQAKRLLREMEARGDPNIRPLQIQNLLGCSDRNARRVVAKLVEDGRLRREVGHTQEKGRFKSWRRMEFVDRPPACFGVPAHDLTGGVDGHPDPRESGSTSS